ncbi:MAG: FCD domain-containing protein [Propionibacteriales bacterium]|nr:FCD domain-containing protein [Propionibacteriales bacterium]
MEAIKLGRKRSEEQRVVSLAIGEDERRTAHQLVRDTLRQAILTGQISGGERLVQAELAQQMRVSTTPVREALRDLAAEGLIRLDAHRGAIVHSPSQSELEEIYRLRQLLEPEIMERAIAHITDEQLEEATRILQRADQEEDPTTWIDLNRQFHRLFTRATHSTRLAAIVESLQDSATLYILVALTRGTRSTDEANAQHWQLLEAVRARDVQAARKVMLAHIHQTVDAQPDLPER